MATWGPAPFASDAGQGLLDQLAGSTDDERRTVLREILAGAPRMGERGFGHGAEASVVTAGVGVELRAHALAGLEQMLRPGNDWHATWIDGDDGDKNGDNDDKNGEGARTARAIAAVLRSSLG